MQTAAAILIDVVLFAAYFSCYLSRGLSSPKRNAREKTI